MIKLVEELSAYLIKYMLDPTKLTSQNLSSKGGRMIWENARQQEHEASMGKEDINDDAEIPFGSLTSQLEIFSTIGINHSSALSLARYNKDFYRNKVELCKWHKKNKTKTLIGEQGSFFNLGFRMYQSLFQTSLQLSTGVHEADRNAIETQSEKKEKKQTLLKKRLEDATKKYIDKLHHRNMFDSEACLEFCAQIDNKIKQITSISGRKEVMKDQIIIRVLGLAW